MAARRNSSGQFARCVKAVSRSRSAYDPAAVCAASERRRGLMNGKKNPLPLVAAQALETSTLAPYQKKAGKEAKKLQERLGLKLNGRKRTNPRNPADQSAAVYEGLHGRPSTEQVEIITEIHEHEHVAAYGELVALFINPINGRSTIKVSGFETKNGRPAFLTTNEKRTQLFVDGGDQTVDVELFGVKSPIHETEVLGELVRVQYYTVKDHLGRDGGEAVYGHKFSRRRRPTVIYDTRNRLLYLAGGMYENLDEGITN